MWCWSVRVLFDQKASYRLTEFRGFMSSPREIAESLWEEFFRDPSQFLDVRNVKRSIKSPDFRHKFNGKALWIDGFYNPPWVQAKLQRIQLPYIDVKSQDDRDAIIQLIKSSGKKKDIACIRKLCADNEWITQDVVIATTLIHSFAKCGSMKEARNIFEQIPEPNVVSWTSLLGGYADQGFGKEALNCFREMQRNRVKPNSVTYICTLKACAYEGAIEIVEEIHALVREQSLLNKDLALGNMLVYAYARCGAVKEAREVFDKLKEPNVVSWTTLIDGYVEQGFGKEALTCFREMQRNRVAPNSVTYTCTLKACSIVGIAKVVEEIHAKVREQGLLNKDIVLGSTLVNAYAKCGAVNEAQKVFEQLAEPNVVSWTALMAGYVDQGFGEEALTCFREMQTRRVTPNSVTYTCALKACGIVGAVEVVEEIHVRVREQGLLNKDIVLGSMLVNAYAKCCAMKEAREVFDQLAECNAVSWNALIGGYADHGYGREALTCFLEMEKNEVAPDSVTYTCTLKACALVGAFEIVEEIYAQAREQALINKDIVFGSTLVNAYSKCGAVNEAQEVFDVIAEPDAVCWNALISGYADRGFGKEALKCFREMERGRVTPDSVTYTCALKACAILGDMEIVEKIHASVREKALLNKDIVLGNMLVDAYAKCGALKEAQEIFDRLAEPNVVSWTALIAGYADQGLGEEALRCFKEMEKGKVAADSVTYVCCLKACTIVGAVEIVKEIHLRVRDQELLNKDILLGNMLVDAYAKCGAVREAQEVFDKLAEPDIVSWNELIACYAKMGSVNDMLKMFNRMIVKGFPPDNVTFIVLLNGCSHGALLDEGQQLFCMITIHCLSPTVEHYTCMVDLFGRAGAFDKAKCFVLDHTSSLLAFLGACLKWENVDHGRWAFEKLLQLDRRCASAYVCMSNIYAVAGMTKEAEEVEFLRVKENINTYGNETVFVVTDESYPLSTLL